jgi:periplasmic protein CpxP/Spy
MKKLISGHFLAKRTLLLAGVLALASTAVWSQNDAPPEGQMRPRGGNPQRELQQLTERLNLTADQQGQVKTLLAERTQKMEALRNAAPSADGSAAPAPREQMQAIRADTDTKINALLNDDQKAKFAALQQERKQRMERRQNPGGDSPASAPPGV